MKVVSLFSGAGGLDLGFIQAGFEIIWANDILPFACDTYATNKKYFNAKRYDNPEERYNGTHRIFCGEIEKIKSFRNAVGTQEVDLVIGGFPCQDFSILRGSEKNGRGGVTVKRGRLYCHFVRGLAELQPKMFVAENVKGLTHANGGKAFSAIIEDFENLNDRWGDIRKEYGNFKNANIKDKSNGFQGYHIMFKDVINFAKVGVPQNRERLIIIGLRKDFFQKLKNNNVPALRDFDMNFKGKFLTIGTRNLSKYPMTPIEILHGKTLAELKDEYKSMMEVFKEPIEDVDSDRKRKYMESIWTQYSMRIWDDYFLLTKNHSKSNKNKLLLSFDSTGEIENIQKIHGEVLHELGYNNISSDELMEKNNINSEILSEQEQVIERMKHIPPGENHEFVKNTKYHVTGLMSNIYKRIHPLKPSPTIIAKGGGGTWGYHFDKNRQRLTNRERARLQTFPDDFIFVGGPSQIRTQIGNAVPPYAAKKIAEEVKKILQELN